MHNRREYRLRVYWTSPRETYTDTWHASQAEADAVVADLAKSCPDLYCAWIITPEGLVTA